MSFNWVDYIVLFIFFGSMLAGLTRGFIKEILGLLTWVVALVVASIFSKQLAAYFTNTETAHSIMASASNSLGNHSTSVSLFAVGASFVGIFIGVLIIGKVINYLISSAVEGRGISFFNRFLGGLFGLGRGFIIIIVIMFIISLTPVSKQLYWTQSQFVHSFQPAVMWLANIVQPGIENLKSKVAQTLRNVNDKLDGVERTLDVF